MRFDTRELFDLAVAWIALGVAFALFFDSFFGVSLQGALLSGDVGALLSPAVVRVFALSMLTAGIGFLLHELAHKVVAQRFGQIAGFRADYGMLFIAVVSALAGFLFAAPGAVYHQGRITERQNGLIALAGPVTNLVLAVAFAPLALLAGGFLGVVGAFGVGINLLLAGFNMLPFGPLDGRKVLSWSVVVFAVAFVVSVGSAVFVLLTFGVGL
ncbi:zinc metalloprotease [Halococcus agarilyticus]|uniref:Zn-dependent protease n=1 Tax=Halococcus agarilyticus TaxID=1232219 RepID=UPI0006783360|nr:Zn-dependent protease [Halococcus agarilyticus]